ncbi:9270_t:CDS:2 [Funneliformis mosseae]|uniref:9270_t:CDS:1 n=1 Tax=Funneliformis mosseae TaxID=27381 RepID=A0A9N8YLL9_FUNMO|nr:9270_t:CDS:2 [Funneliformis mosseae]
MPVNKFASKSPFPTKKIIDSSLFSKYQRRVQNLGLAKYLSPFSRSYHVGSIVVTVAAGAYIVLYADFKQDHHCFVPVRNWYHRKINEFWTLSDKEKQELREQGKL